MKATELKPKDLRIGNLIIGYYENDCQCTYGDCQCDLASAICEVLSLDTLGYSDYSIMVESKETRAEHFEKFLPIPLNEEWIVKLGFEKTPLGFKINIGKKRELTLSICNDKGKGEYYFYVRDNEDFTGFNMRLFTVHQLQNLYHALTGLELTIK